MHSSLRAARTAAAFFLGALFLLISAGGAFAQSSTFLAGIVTANNLPVAGARVTAVGSNLQLHAQTDAGGKFTSRDGTRTSAPPRNS